MEDSQQMHVCDENKVDMEIEQTDWEGGYYPITPKFNEDYPSKPPVCKFPRGFFLRPCYTWSNVYPSGMVCLSILSESDGWRPAITIKQILVGIQDMLDTPNPASPAQGDACRFLTKDLVGYKQRVRDQGKRYPPIA
ncbi:SUMO-conjugating enzyme SCE1-like [Bidens hawaiensis]|uniref:SUMO-conjugating enzyme SCE1-like n=1 Tax=Bidens hawaiensis TaxID=980011 RepID=UPI004049DBFC